MLIEVPYFKQETLYTCGAANCGMYLSRFGMDKSESEKWSLHHEAFEDMMEIRSCYVRMFVGGTNVYSKGRRHQYLL